MRLWSIHPKYLDQKGLVALWREGLLAKKVLQGRTKGYKNHPQLNRFKSKVTPIKYINKYLLYVWEEADVRGYKFDLSKLDMVDAGCLILVTNGQINYERERLALKLFNRDKKRLDSLPKICKPHPLFKIIQGDVEPWEIITS